MIMIYIHIPEQNTNQFHNRRKRKTVRESEEQCKMKYLPFHLEIAPLDIFIKTECFDT